VLAHIAGWLAETRRGLFGWPQVKGQQDRVGASARIRGRAVCDMLHRVAYSVAAICRTAACNLAATWPYSVGAAMLKLCVSCF
jgi:hypothetical protein